MTLGVEFEEDTFGGRSQITPTSTFGKPSVTTSSNHANLVGQIQSANLQNYQNFFVGQNLKASKVSSDKGQPLFVRWILKTGIVKSQLQAEIAIVVMVFLMLSIATYFLFQTYSNTQINTINIK